MQAMTSRSWYKALLTAAIAVFAMWSGSPVQAADDLTEMSLEDLMNLTVTSASKRAQSKVDAAAAITVLTHEDIRRSGATHLPEVLRLVPGMNVARVDAHRWSISIRGNQETYANKLLVLIDGRVVYTPLFGGVYWDVQDLVMEDIERIEVIRGPGGTLWGANAVNGVINVTTKSAKDTQGAYASGVVGNQEYLGEGRFGGQIGDDIAYRVWGRGFKADDYTLPDFAPYPANDGWKQWRVGARMDADVTENDLVTIQGDFYDGADQEIGDVNPNPFIWDFEAVPSAQVRGGNVLARWTHTFSETQSLEFQGYWDQTDRNSYQTTELRNSVDVLAQHNFTLGSENQWLFNWGLEYFWTGDDVEPGVGTDFDPQSQNFSRFSGFAQAQWNLFDDSLQIIGGTKLEWNNYTDFEYQPTGRVLWKFFEGNAVWTAVSRAVRAPTRVDRDITYGALLTGNKDIESENLFAFEFGYRNYMLENVTLDVTTFFNKYSDLNAVVGGTFVNASKEKAWGAEAEVAWAPVEGLRFVTAYTYLQMNDEPAEGALSLTAVNELSSPRHTWMLRGLWNLPVIPVEVDGTVWYVGKLPGLFNPAFGVPSSATSPIVEAYWRFDARVAWQALDWLALEVAGQNLTSKSHIEWGEGALPVWPGTYVPRTYYGKVTLTF